MAASLEEWREEECAGLSDVVEVSARQAEGQAQGLAKPRVATVNGVPAVVQTEERFPIFATQASSRFT